MRAVLNFGHTFGHAIENGLGYGTWLHGEAVAAGMVLAARLSVDMGSLDPREARRIRDALAYARLPVTAPVFEFARWMDLMELDKKASAGTPRFVLLRGLGAAYIAGASEERLAALLATGEEGARTEPLQPLAGPNP